MKTKYIEFLEFTGKSAAAINAAIGAEKLFKKLTGRAFKHATRQTIKNFVRRAREEAKTEAQKRTIIQRFNTLKQIAKFNQNFNQQKMLNEIDIKRVLKAQARGPLSDDWTTKAFSAEEQSAIIAECNRQKKPLWFRPIISLYAATGARLSELTALTFRDVAPDANSIIVIGKGRKARRAEIINPQATAALKEYIAYRQSDPHREPSPDDYIFKTQKIASPHVTPRAVEQQFDKILLKLGIKRAGRAIHCFRHTFATNAIEGGAPVHIVAAQLGHANINTTIQHYTHTKAETIRRELRQALLFDEPSRTAPEPETIPIFKIRTA